KSAKEKEDLGYFGDSQARAIVEDAVCFTRLMKEKYPKLPIYLYGHSMGSMVVRCYLQKYDSEINKLIVSGAPNKNPLVGTGIALTKTIKLLKGDRHRSETLKKLSTGGSENAFPFDGKKVWLTRDKSVFEKYEKDPFCNYTFTVNGFENLFHLLKNTYDEKLFSVSNPDLPVRFVAGSDDPIIGGEDKWLYGQEFLRKLGYQKVSGKLYHGMRHEPHNEIGKEEVWADILAFLLK
ncbi:MAG: alpha/beta hydrolase, partial [Clostridia bacterium]|nr:alpha/beta hydrolase [Clostridia bacterium]